MRPEKKSQLEDHLADLEDELLVSQRDINTELESVRLSNAALVERHHRLDSIQAALTSIYTLREHLEHHT